MKRGSIVIKIIMTAFLPFGLVFVYFEELFRNMRRAFGYAWLEVRINFSAYLDIMNERPEDFE